MQNAGTAFPVSPAGHFGGGTAAAALALALAEGAALAGGASTALLALAAAADADVAGADPFASSLSHATRASNGANARHASRGRAGTVFMVRRAYAETFSIGGRWEHGRAETLRGGTSVLRLWGTVENGGLEAALRVVRAELAGAVHLTNADFDKGRWSLAREYDLRLATPDAWVSRALASAKQSWGLEGVDVEPGVLATFQRARFVEALHRCASEGVVSIVGDEPTARRALAKAWP
jgi:hypothetical protein